MGGSPGGFDMNNPMIMGLLSLFASQNPQTAGPALDKLGIPPPMGLTGGGANIGEMVNPERPALMQQSVDNPPQQAAAPQGGEMIPSGGDAAMRPLGVPPAAAPAGGPSPQQLAQLAAMSGVKAPQAIQPVMHGGVTGGVKAPQVELGGGFGTGVPPGIAMLLQTMASGQRQNPLVAPDIGSLIRGRG